MSEIDTEFVPRLVKQLQERLEPFILGQEGVIRLLAGAILIGGHVLLEGPPGVGKTLLAKGFARCIGLRFNRIQFTPDLMPSDVLGVNVFDQRTGEFKFSPGPITADIVLADEINRTPPKTQAALLEAMEERGITVDGKRYALHDLFFVIATQNPVEHEGTFPLPEAQLDRFLFKIAVTYPPAQEEQRMVETFASRDRFQGGDRAEYLPEPIVDLETLRRGAQTIRAVTLSTSISDYIYRIVRATRDHRDLLLGASPRAALHLALAVKFQAAANGRGYVIPDDVQQIISVTLAHRLIFKPESFERATEVAGLISEVVAAQPVPSTIGG